jgi:hypothetical protein
MYQDVSTADAVPQSGVPIERPHAGLGIASFILSIAAGIMLFVVFVVAGVMEASTQGGIDETSPIAVLIGLFMFALLGLEVIAFGLGIIGLCQRQRRKLFAILGMIFSGMALAVTAGLILVGLCIA